MNYIALLRGINVSGKNKLPMQELRDLLKKLGLLEVETYIQSGNVVFSAAQDDWGPLIQKVIQDEYKYQVPTLVLSEEAFRTIIDKHPYQHLDPSYLHVTFFNQPPNPELSSNLVVPAAPGEMCTITDSACFLYLPNGYGRTKLNNNFFEQKLKVQATTRNWKTCQKLLSMIESKH